MEDFLQRKMNSRSGKLSQLAPKKNELMYLMEKDCIIEMVKTKLAIEFSLGFEDFQEANDTVKEQSVCMTKA